MVYQLKFNKTFLKELAQLPPKQREKIEQFVFEDLNDIHSIENIPNLKKLKGFKHYYRIRFGNYRAGISFRNNEILFERLLHRKDIYKYFP